MRVLWALLLQCLTPTTLESVTESRGQEGAGANEPERPPRRYRVVLVDEARVVERGEELRVWYLPEETGLIRAFEHPQALVDETSEERPPPPGVIWERSTELELVLHTVVICRNTRPWTERLGPLEYLERGRLHTLRHVVETQFLVVGNYRIEKLASRRLTHDLPEPGASQRPKRR